MLKARAESLPAFFAQPPERSLSRICRRALAASQGGSLDEMMAALRYARQDAALLIALADVGGVWRLEEVCRALSSFATASCRAALNWLVAESGVPLRQSGLAVLAMGKYGARELNYSSDIDLVVLYREEAAADVCIDITRKLADALSRPTGDGYVFRVDLRLRPDPAVTPPAVPANGALNYYESFGQHWERAAYIRARPVAGDRGLGEEFLRDLSPFIWRKYLDYAVAEDMTAMKRQVRAQPRFRDAGAGSDIKRGAGGIREIEFFIQTQQLILGGRNPALRRAGTTAMLGRLAASGWISRAAARDMAAAYRFWRYLEHRLQMLGDEQTHSLPVSEEGLENLARFAGFPSAESLLQMVRRVSECVSGHFDALFSKAPPLASDSGPLVFTGSDDDPQTLQTLRAMGFTTAESVAATVRSWYSGRLRAARPARARELLTRLVPAILAALARNPRPDESFARFHHFLESLPASVQLFALLQAHPSLLELTALLCAAAPRLAGQFSRQPATIEAMLAAPASFDALNLRHDLRRALTAAENYEEVLDRSRRWAREQQFRIGVDLLRGAITPAAAGETYSLIAVCLIERLYARARAETMRRSPRRKPPTSPGAMAVLALGTLGAMEMSASSDVDLVMIHDSPRSSASSPDDYIRLAQVFVSAISVPTAEGTLYPVDTRLRPSGRAGPLALSIDAFVEYQKNRAWIWEIMALTRARPIAGAPALCRRLAAEIKGILCAARDRSETAKAVCDMRARIAENHPKPPGIWEYQAIGGALDIEFIAQYIQLVHAAKMPDILHPHTAAVLTRAAEAGVLPQPAAASLLAALTLYQTLRQLQNLCLEAPFDPKLAGSAFGDLLVRATGVDDFSALEKRLQACHSEVQQIFSEQVGEPKRL